MAREDPPAYHDMSLATMYHLDPERLAAIRRIATGMTRCPECDALNLASQKRCDKCGAKLYPEVTDDEPAKKGEDEVYVPPKKQEKKPEEQGDTEKSPYY